MYTSKKKLNDTHSVVAKKLSWLRSISVKKQNILILNSLTMCVRKFSNIDFFWDFYHCKMMS